MRVKFVVHSFNHFVAIQCRCTQTHIHIERKQYLRHSLRSLGGDNNVKALKEKCFSGTDYTGKARHWYGDKCDSLWLTQSSGDSSTNSPQSSLPSQTDSSGIHFSRAPCEQSNIVAGSQFTASATATAQYSNILQ